MPDFILKKTISPKFIAAARKKAPKKPLNNRSITKGEGALIGAIGEFYVMEMFLLMTDDDEAINYADNYDYDIVLDDIKYDVKSKKRTVPPEPGYNATVADYSIKIQMCDVYQFTSITVDRDALRNGKDVPLDFYYIGHETKQGFRDVSTFGRKGEPDPEGGNRRTRDDKPFTFTADCWNTRYGNLSMFDLEDVEPLLSRGYTIIHWNK